MNQSRKRDDDKSNDGSTGSSSKKMKITSSLPSFLPSSSTTSNAGAQMNPVYIVKSNDYQFIPPVPLSPLESIWDRDDARIPLGKSYL